MSFLFGSTETKNELPPWLEDASKEMLDRSVNLGQTGYMPYAGPQVAALSPQEYAAMENTAGAANAFGMATPQPGGDLMGQTHHIDPTQFGEESGKAERIIKAYKDILGREPDADGFQYWMSNFNPDNFEMAFRSGASNPETLDPMTGLPMPGNFNGMRGYSSLPMFTDQMNYLQQNRPGQYDYYNSFFIDPNTGTAGANTTPGAQQAANPGQAEPDYGGAGDHGYGGGPAGANYGGGGGGFFGGYSGLGDMMDGGGPGQSGSTFGGAFGGVSNGIGATPSGSGQSPGGIFGGLW